MKLSEKDLSRNRKEIFTKTVWRENENRMEEETVIIKALADVQSFL